VSVLHATPIPFQMKLVLVNAQYFGAAVADPNGWQTLQGYKPLTSTATRLGQVIHI
jgi:hypothetical protein